jgi:hypothetical protein
MAAKETTMHRFLLGAVAVTLSLALAATTRAGPQGHSGGGHPGGSHPGPKDHASRGYAGSKVYPGGGHPGGVRPSSGHPGGSHPDCGQAASKVHPGGNHLGGGHPGGQARPRGDRGGHRPDGYRPPYTPCRNYHLKYGTKFKGGYYYKGKNHCHWTHKYWWGKYGCYTYYCPSSRRWYYWYQPDDCYYPCSCIASATPKVTVAPVGVPAGVTLIVNVSNNSSGSVVPDSPGPPE